jgi:hypothetical protein
VTDFSDHDWRLLPASKDTLRANDARYWVDGAVEDIDSEDVGAMRVGILMPHADYDMSPGMAGRRIVSNKP